MSGYPLEVQRRALELLEDPRRPYAEVAAALGVARQTVWRWAKGRVPPRAPAGSKPVPSAAPRGPSRRQLEAAVAELRRCGSVQIAAELHGLAATTLRRHLQAGARLP